MASDSVVVSVRLEVGLLADMDKLAARRRVSRNALVVEALSMLLGVVEAPKASKGGNRKPVEASVGGRAGDSMAETAERTAGCKECGSVGGLHQRGCSKA